MRVESTVTELTYLHLNRLARVPQDVHIGENSSLDLFLALKQASTSITGRLRWLQPVCPTYHAIEQTCMMVESPVSELTCPKQACTSFTGRTQW